MSKEFVQCKYLTMDLRLLFVAISLVGYEACLAEDRSVTVETKVGTIIGIQREVDVFGEHLNVSQFLGIPYAEPPTGELRFQKPVPKAAFTTPFIAKQHGNICFQQHMIPPTELIRYSEDCLLLNVYTPVRSSGDLPVMIWIHGGAFVFGSADEYAGDILAGFREVILVTINYRLSVWGFLSTGVHTGPKNYGLWDQHQAIHWVHENIEAFGGDIDRVTIFGQSAGSASVVYQSMYEGNRGLFQRAIAQSGSITATWASTTDSEIETRKLGRLVACENEDPITLHDCIKYTSAELLYGTVNNATNGFMGFPMPFIPVLDGEFIQERRENIFEINAKHVKHDFFSNIDLMMGMTSAECSGVINDILGGHSDDFYPNRAHFEEGLVPKYLKSVYGPNVPEAVTVATIAQYTDWSEPDNPENIRDNFVQLCSDVMMTGSITKTIDFHASYSRENVNTYLYRFDVGSPHHLYPSPPWLKRANHGDDLMYLFGFGDAGILSYYLPDENPKLAEWQIQLAKYMMTMWANFAKTGNPNHPTSAGQEWPQYDQARQRYFDITSDISPHSVKQYLFARNANFWNKVIPSIMNDVCKIKESCEQSSPFADKWKDTCDKEAGCSP